MRFSVFWFWRIENCSQKQFLRTRMIVIHPKLIFSLCFFNLILFYSNNFFFFVYYYFHWVALTLNWIKQNTTNHVPFIHIGLLFSLYIKFLIWYKYSYLKIIKRVILKNYFKDFLYLIKESLGVCWMTIKYNRITIQKACSWVMELSKGMNW